MKKLQDVINVLISFILIAFIATSLIKLALFYINGNP
jgi:hypothetical protein